MKKLFVLFAVLGLFTACSSTPKFKVNDVVLADWYQGNWHIGKVTEVCKTGGWKVSFNDSFYNSASDKEPVCYTEEKLVQNTAPSSSSIESGDVVLAEWMEDAFYAAKVQKIDGDKYSVKFVSDGWESDLTLDKLRVMPEQPKEEVPAKVDVKINSETK
ncbi:hypothetical protein KBC97_01260 [Candidatus Gracilibacteria bacterium]|nr:hypothetical protein [Candidatus Gracilibacteria bacterium]